MNLHLYMIGFAGLRTDKVRARRIYLDLQNTMNLPVWSDSGKEDEP